MHARPVILMTSPCLCKSARSSCFEAIDATDTVDLSGRRLQVALNHRDLVLDFWVPFPSPAPTNLASSAGTRRQAVNPPSIRFLQQVSVGTGTCKQRLQNGLGTRIQVLSVRHAANFPIDERYKQRRSDPAVLVDLLKKTNRFADRPRVGLSICDADLEMVWPRAQIFRYLKNKGLPRPDADVVIVDPDFCCHS